MMTAFRLADAATGQPMALLREGEMQTFAGSGAAAVLDRIKGQLEAFRHPDATPLMVSWQMIIREDNRRGVLAGLDKDGQPMQPVTYRPKGKDQINIRSKTAARLRNSQRANRMRNLLFAGHGLWAAGLHNNLTSAEYRKLNGPPLAPRGQFSRVISNLVTGFEPPQSAGGSQVWTAFAAWKDVVGRDGITEFLVYHFDGRRLGKHGPSIKRDLRGIRPDGWQELQAAYEAWERDWLRSVIG